VNGCQPPSARTSAKSMTDDSDLRATGYYESGHAVVAWSLNLRVHNVSIRADNVRAGETNTDPANHLPIEDQLAILVAGREAAHIFDAQAHPSKSHADMERQFELLNGRPEQEQFALIHEAHERARRRLIEHKPKVALLAERLVAAALNVDDSEFLRLMQSHPIANV